MRAVISVTGKDDIGIVADVSALCRQYNVSIDDLSQTLMQQYFVMIMLVNLDHMKGDFSDFVDAMSGLGQQRGLVIHTMHEEIFNAMHTI